MKRNRRRTDRLPGARPIEPPFKSISAKTAGLPPGSAVYAGDNEPTKALLSLYVYDEGSWRMECPTTTEALLSHIESGKKNWINVNGLAGGAVERLCEALGVHALVVEDILDPGQRPRVENYDEYLYLVTKMLTTHRDGSVEYEQVSLILKGDVVVTFQETPGDCFGAVRERIVSGTGRMRRMGADYLAYSLLDVIVDNYFIVLEKLGDALEAYEFEASNPKAAKRFMAGIQELKGNLIRLRRSIWPVRDSIASLLRSEAKHLSPELAPFLRDLHENTVQVIEALETYREHTASILEIHLSSMSNRMNEVMKVLTIISTIFIPLTFIAGVYGMNFRFMPELERPWGYPVVLGVMALVAIGELVYFKIRKWI
ncbi:MAG: magnesium/cobalt transporter CorA [Spirochaetaceae bacterium]|nr:magnesium/cobalt transporter CorA [Spirochaetaceae bacterium]